MKGIPYNVTVFATNGRGNGPSVSKITYAEEDGKYYSFVFTAKNGWSLGVLVISVATWLLL